MGKRIFISYAHDDRESINKIVGVIEKNVDCELWFDKKLHGGEEYFSIIAERILECEYFLFVVSSKSVTSQWCIKELEFAMSEQKKIIAVWLEEISPPPRVRLVISNTHYLKNYELSEEALAKNMADALNSSYYDLFRGEKEYKLSEMKSESEKYFISPNEKRKITDLLNSEEKQDFLTCFEPENAVLLGLAYEMGIGVESDNVKADFYYHIASYKGSMDGEYLALSLGLANGTVDKPATIKRMYELADAGCLRALVYWGDEVYLGNWNMAADKATSYRWFKHAADLGDPVAKYFLGYGYRKGEVGTTDYAVAWMYFCEAAQQGYTRAYRQIAFMYKNGEMVEKNLDMAKLCFQKAVDAGDVFTENFLGDLEYDKMNYEAAFNYYLRSADYIRKRNLPKSVTFYNLGWCYEFGQGVEKSIEKAIDCYLEGAEKKNSSCMKRVCNLIYYETSDGYPKATYLEKAAKYNCNYAEYYLGKLSEQNTDGCRKQNLKALFWLEQGADKGCINCIEKLTAYYSWIFGAKEFEDREKAIGNFSLLFSILDRDDNKKILEERKGNHSLYQYYYVYALELDIDAKNNNPDRQMALHYFKKCLEGHEKSEYWFKILGFAGDRLSADTANFNYIKHSEQILDLCYDSFDGFCSAFSTGEKHRAVERLAKAYDAIGEAYKKAKDTNADKKEAVKNCKNKAKAIQAKL